MRRTSSPCMGRDIRNIYTAGKDQRGRSRRLPCQAAAVDRPQQHTCQLLKRPPAPCSGRVTASVRTHRHHLFRRPDPLPASDAILFLPSAEVVAESRKLPHESGKHCDV